MARSMRVLRVQCTYAENGGTLQDILKECFRAFLYKEMQENTIFL